MTSVNKKLGSMNKRNKGSKTNTVNRCLQLPSFNTITHVHNARLSYNRRLLFENNSAVSVVFFSRIQLFLLLARYVLNVAKKEYTPWARKKVPLLFLRYLWLMWTDFNNSFTFRFVDKLRNMVK